MSGPHKTATGFARGAGALCLDFANTAADRVATEREEKLGSYRDLVNWSREAGLLSAAQSAMLLKHLAAGDNRHTAVLRRAIELRETIYRICSAIASGKGAEVKDLSTLNAAWLDAVAKMKVQRISGRYELLIDSIDFEYPIHRAVMSAMELLTKGPLERLRQCASETCDWLFLDQSRNQSRRWCDMQICGSRIKARRYYGKLRKNKSHPLRRGTAIK